MVPTVRSMFGLTIDSHNRKTGRMAVSTSPKQTCPVSCPFRSKACYSNAGKMLMWWNRFSSFEGEIESCYDEFLSRCSARIPNKGYWRHNQAGDLFPVFDVPDCISLSHARRLTEVGRDKKAFGYSHYPVVCVSGVSDAVVRVNRQAIAEMNAEGFTMNASANSPSHADRIFESGFKNPIVTVLPKRYILEKIKTSKTPNGLKIVTCPATIRDDMTCLSCKLCMKSKRDFIVGFPSHGTNANASDRLVDSWSNGFPS